MADAIRRSIRALPPRAAERRSAVRASGLLENAAREGRRHRGQHELHLRQGPGTVFQIRGGERAGGGDRVPQGAAQQSLRDLLRRNRRAVSETVRFGGRIDGRGMDGGSSGVSERMVNMLLTEMDGLEDRKQVFVIAATNRPDIIDPAMMRPGRLDQLLLVPLPTQSDRLDILRTITKKTPLADDVDLEKIAFDERCEVEDENRE